MKIQENRKEKWYKNLLKYVVLIFLGIIYARFNFLVFEFLVVFEVKEVTLLAGLSVFFSVVLIAWLIYKLVNLPEGLNIGSLIGWLIVVFLLMIACDEYSKVKAVEIFDFKEKSFLEIHRELFDYFSQKEGEETQKKRLNEIIKSSFEKAKKNAPFSLRFSDFESFPDARNFKYMRAQMIGKYGKRSGVNMTAVGYDENEETNLKLWKKFVNTKEREELINEVDNIISDTVLKKIADIASRITYYFLSLTLMLLGIVLYFSIISVKWFFRGRSKVSTKCTFIDNLLEVRFQGVNIYDNISYDIMYILYSLLAVICAMTRIVWIEEGLNYVNESLGFWFTLSFGKILIYYIEYSERKKESDKIFDEIYKVKRSGASKINIEHWLRNKEIEKEKVIKTYNLIAITIILAGTLVTTLFSLFYGDVLGNNVVEALKGLNNFQKLLSVTAFAINLALFLANLKLFVTHSYTVWKIETEILVVQYLRDKMDESKNRHNRYK